VRARKFSYNGTTMYDLLKTIDDPADLRRLDRRQLQPLADELRAYVLDSVS
jgi:1-deoxy-D-xylulose-5-phosphate synthase